MSDKDKIDEGLYSRQLYAIGHDAMKKLAHSNILISGLSGLGTEIAKNVILQGFNSVTVHDTQKVSMYDLGTNFYVTEQDVNKNIAEVVYHKLKELNNYVSVKCFTGALHDEMMSEYNVIILVDYDLKMQVEINNFCRANNIKFISCATVGMTGQIFCDFGESFVSFDTTGEQLEPVL